MADSDTGANLLARKEYAKALPLLKDDLDKYPSNPRIRLQYADALAGSGQSAEAVAQYEHTAKYYEDNGLTVQPMSMSHDFDQPIFSPEVPKSPLFEVLNPEERAALIKEMDLEQHGEGDVILSEGDTGSSMYVIAHGEVKVYTRGTTSAGGNVYLAKLGEGDFFGEVSVLTGKPRTATITASKPTELLRLDKEKLDNALAKYPGIRKVLDDFYKQRAKHTVEAMIESLKKRGS